MLQNEYLVAKIGVDTAENEPSKVSRKWGVQNGSARGHLQSNSLFGFYTVVGSDRIGDRSWKLAYLEPYRDLAEHKH